MEILKSSRNTNFEELQTLIDITQILNVTTIDWTAPSWARSTLSHDQVITWTMGKVRVYSDSVPCLGKRSDHSEANRRWENQVEEFRQSNSFRELLGIDGETIEFEWRIFPGLSSLEILQKIQEDLQDRHIEPEKSEDRLIFMSMFNDIEWFRNISPHVVSVPRYRRRSMRSVAVFSQARKLSRELFFV